MKNMKSGKGKIKAKTQRRKPITVPPPGSMVCSVDQAALMLQIGRVSIYKLLRAGKLESRLIGDRIRRITLASIQKLATGGEGAHV
jgi:hypothetical protein